MVIAGQIGSMHTGGMLRYLVERSGRDLQGRTGTQCIEANTCSFRMWVPWEMLLAVGATVQHTVVTVFRTF